MVAIALERQIGMSPVHPGPINELITVPIIPSSYRHTLLLQHHTHPSAGHLGPDKIASRIRKVGYWVGMLYDINQYCRECSVCQSSKPPSPQKAPLHSMPIGRPWQMITVDILEVPLSFNNNRYLLVIQDYFSKWVDAIPLSNQKADSITKALVKVFAIMACPTSYTQIRAPILKAPFYVRHLKPLVSKNLGPPHIIHKEMAWSNVLIAPCFKCFALMLMIMHNGSNTCHLFYLHIALRYMLRL